MAKELVVSTSSHETKVAIVEENQVVEAYFERTKEHGLAGSIYKGRVTRVLPGMQSAFVDIGLDRDAFLYVSDFFEDTEEYDKIVTSVEEKVIKMEETRLAEPAVAEGGGPPEPEAKAEPPAAPPAESSPPAAAERPSRPAEEPYSRRSRRHRPRRGRGFPDSKYSRQDPPDAPPKVERPTPDSPSLPAILPGESLAKYRDWFAPAEKEQAGETAQAEEQAASVETSPSAIVSPATDSRGTEPASSGEGPAIPPNEPAPPSYQALSMPAFDDFDEEPDISALEAPPALPRPLVEAVSGAPVEPEPQAGTADRPAWGAAEQTEQQPIAAPAPETEEAAGRETLASEASLLEKQSPEAAFEEPRLAEPVLEGETPGAPPEAGAGESPEPAGEGVSGGSAGPAPEPRTPKSQQAAVREGHRHPRYMRRSRWAARRETREESARRSERPRERAAAPPQIADLLKEGQEIIVQIAKEPLGKKGARITSHIALPGRYLVYMPTVNHVGVSHKIGSEEERHRLKRIIVEHSRNIPGGFIVRTAGEGASEEEFRLDIRFLANLWADIKTQAEKAKAPALLHHDLDLVQRILRDQLSEEFTTVWVDNEAEYERLVNWVSRFQPSLVGRVKLYTKDVPLFEQMGIQEEINKALKSKIWLKSGGYIVINQTEALVAIDVNTGKFVGKSSRLEDTIVKTNVDAIQEIVRQIRLRDLGGIIVIDFIDMDERKNRHRVMAALEEALRGDRAPSKILAFNEFGLVAITRKRVRQSLERTLGQPCPQCGGSGFVKSAATVCCEIYTEARKMAEQLRGKQITLRVNPEVGKALKARDNTILAEIEEMTRKPVVVRNDPALHIESFAFE